MPRLKLQPTIMAQWYELVKEAQSERGRYFSDDLEHYLAVTLQRYIDRPDVLNSVLALEYLDAIDGGASYQRETLRDVGDKCLLFSGLFPEQADSKKVSINYFVDLGRSAYSKVADNTMVERNTAKLFDDLVEHFIGLMDTLHAVREMRNSKQTISLLQAFDLWEHTNSQYAKDVIERHTDGFFLKGYSTKND